MLNCSDCLNYQFCDNEEKNCGICEAYEKKPTNNYKMTPYERTRAQVYATGNKWAIENFNATH